MKLLLAFAALLLPMPAAAQDVRTLGDGESPAATIDQVAWLAGCWVGSGMGGVSQECWVPPIGGQMEGVFRQGRDGAVQFSEILQIVERDGTLAVRLKHFNADLSGWEDNSAESAIEFPLAAIEQNAAYFSGLTYRLADPDTLHIYLRMRRGGETEIISFELTRMD